MEISGETAWKS